MFKQRKPVIENIERQLATIKRLPYNNLSAEESLSLLVNVAELIEYAGISRVLQSKLLLNSSFTVEDVKRFSDVISALDKKPVSVQSPNLLACVQTAKFKESLLDMFEAHKSIDLLFNHDSLKEKSYVIFESIKGVVYKIRLIIYTDEHSAAIAKKCNTVFEIMNTTDGVCRPYDFLGITDDIIYDELIAGVDNIAERLIEYIDKL